MQGSSTSVSQSSSSEGTRLLHALHAGVALAGGAPGCSSKAGAININDFLPLPHSVVPRRPTVLQPGCFYIGDTVTFLSCKSLQSRTSSPRQAQSMTSS